MLDITIDSSKYDFVDVDNWRCNYPNGNSQSMLSCSLPYLDKSGTNKSSRTIPLALKLKTGTSISSDVKSISMDLKFSTKCAQQQGYLLSRTLTVPVVHHWTMKAVQSPDQSDKLISWNSEDEDDEEVTQAYLTYRVFNTGPSMTQQSTIFVYIPSTQNSKGLLKDVEVMYTNTACKVANVRRIQRPPVIADTTADKGEKV